MTARALLIACLLGLYTCHSAFSKPHPSPTATPAPKPRTDLVCRTKQQDAELRDWIGGIMTEAQKAKTENDAAQKSNADLQSQLAKATTDAQNLANECAADKACAKAPLSCWFHRLIKHLLWLAFGLMVLLVALVILNFFFPFLGPILRFIAAWFGKILSMFKPKPPTSTAS